MTDTARDVIMRALRDDFGPFGPRAPSVYADSLIEALHTAGYRILAPGELDGESLEAAAKVARECFDDPQAETDPDYVPAAIREMKEAGK